MRAVRRSYGHNKLINVIWKAYNAVKREHVDVNSGDDVLFWPLDQRAMKLKFKSKMMSGDIFFCMESYKNLKFAFIYRAPSVFALF